MHDVARSMMLLQGGSYEGEWRGGDREGMGIRIMRSGKVLAGSHLIIFQHVKGRLGAI